MSDVKNILFVTKDEKQFVTLHDELPSFIKFFFAHSINNVSKLTSSIKFSLIIFDYDEDHFKNNTVLEYLYNKKTVKFLPLIFLVSNTVSLDLLTVYLSKDNVDFVFKPIYSQIFINKINNFINLIDQQGQVLGSKDIIMKILANSNDMIMIYDQKTGFLMNSKSLLSFFRVNYKIKTFVQWSEFIHPEDRAHVNHNLSLEKLTLSHFKLKFRLKSESKYVPVTFSGELIRNNKDEVTHIIALIEDETKQHNMSSSFSGFDEVTGLPSRQMFFYRFKVALSQAKRYNSKLAILLLDIDNFKRINNSLGHKIGDLLLKSIVERLQSALKECDSISRIGGDEYAFILTEVQTPKDAVLVAKELFKSLSKSFNVMNHEIFLTASIGITFFPDDGEDSDVLIKNATLAMSKAKNIGQNSYQLYESEANVKTFEILALENRLRTAIKMEELLIYYQPRVNIGNGEIIGLEALVRWEHPDLGIISPAEFIPIAEETGLIVPIGEQVLYKACLQYQAWMKQGIKPFNLAVNLSAKQFMEEKFVEKIQNILQTTEMINTNLELEITESMAMKDVNRTINILGQFVDMGIRIAIDDFGTGYSSLSYLRQYPIHVLKIDQSFLKEMIYDQDVVTIIKAILELAKGLKLDVIVEGVEEIEQLELLRMLGCNEMQGFLFAKPLHPKDIFPLLQKGFLSITGMQ